MLIKLIYIFAGLIIVKILYNFYYFLLTRRYLLKYENYTKKSNDWYINDNRQQIVAVLKKVGIKDSALPSVDLAGYGHLYTATISVFDNLAFRRSDIMPTVYSMLREAKSVFKSRIIESFNPIFWLETFIYLPRIIFQYINIQENSIIIRILQIFWWIFNALNIIISILFNRDFISWLKSLL